MARTILVEGKKVMRVTIPDDARITLTEKAMTGTLRIYKGGTTKAYETTLAVFSGVSGFRDLSVVDVSERVATEEVRTVWKSDANDYSQEVVGSVGVAWVDPVAELAAGEQEEQF